MSDEEMMFDGLIPSDEFTFAIDPPKREKNDEGEEKLVVGARLAVPIMQDTGYMVDMVHGVVANLVEMLREAEDQIGGTYDWESFEMLVIKDQYGMLSFNMGLYADKDE